jgi:hypothetical protein
MVTASARSTLVQMLPISMRRVEATERSKKSGAGAFEDVLERLDAVMLRPMTSISS